MIEVGNYNLVQVHYSSIREHLLPYPYETNCFDYRKNPKYYHSKEDCIVKYFERKEFDKCGCNTKWLYYDYRNITQVKICDNSDKCEFNFKYNQLLINKICSKNCYNRYFDYRSNPIINFSAGRAKTFTVTKKSVPDISLTHLPKMNFVEYLCSIGGLFSMWFGISLYHLLLFIKEKTNYCVEKYFRFNQSMIDLRIRFVQYIERLKLKKFFKLFIIVLYSTAMLYQISDVIQNYLKYDLVTRFEINQKQFNPRIRLDFLPRGIESGQLKNIYPEIVEDNDYIKAMKINDIIVRNNKLRRIFLKYFLKLINELRFKELLDITHGNNFIKTCKVFKNKQTFNCSEPRNKISLMGDSNIYVTFEITFENKTNCLSEDNVCFPQSSEKIELELKQEGLTLAFVYYKSWPLNGESVFLPNNSKAEIFFTSYAHKRSNIHKQKCIV
jgi:hypothetical protein